MLEIDPINGNNEKVIVVDKYYVLDRDSGLKDDIMIEWKFDRRQPKIEFKGGNIVHAEENLMKMFKEGEYLVFHELAQKGQKSNKK